MKFTYNFLVLSIISLLFITSCSKDEGSFSATVSNKANSFQLQADGVKNVSKEVEYTWVNDGDKANIDQSTVLSEGTANIVVTDNDGKIVYEDILTKDGSFTTSSGAPGTWKITITFAKATGNINFSLEKP